jgi:hypothetical protein
MMVYNTQNYWGFGLCPSSGIPKKKQLLENNVTKASPPSSEDGNGSSFLNIVLLRIPDDGQ